MIHYNKDKDKDKDKDLLLAGRNLLWDILGSRADNNTYCSAVNAQKFETREHNTV